MPKVSVIIPSYNHENYIKLSIQSVLDQTFQDFEIIIVDDGSKDNTVEEIKKFNDPRIKLIVFEQNQGACVAANTCVTESCGEYVAMLSSDDLFYDNKLATQVSFLDEHPEYAVVFGYAEVIDEDGHPLDDNHHPYCDIFHQPNRSRFEWLNHFFHHGNCLCHPSALIRRECYETIGPYEPCFAGLPDFDFWVRMCLKYEIHILPENLIQFRVRHGEQNASGDRPETHRRNRFEYLQILKHYLKLSRTEDFLKVFPEARQLDHIENINPVFIPFFIAQLALKTPSDIHHLFGLQTLYQLMEETQVAKKMEEKVGFSYSKVIQLSGQYDIFKIAKSRYAQLYIDTGEGFTEEISIICEIIGNELEVEFDLSSYPSVTGLRFDPLDAIATIDLNRICLYDATDNAEHHLPYASNAGYQLENRLFFSSHDPQIHLSLPENVTAEKLIVHVTYISSNADIHKGLMEYIDQINQHQRQLVLKHKETEDKLVLKHKETEDKLVLKHKETEDKLVRQHEEAQYTIQAIKNSFSWKATRPVRWFRFRAFIGRCLHLLGNIREKNS